MAQYFQTTRSDSKRLECRSQPCFEWGCKTLVMYPLGRDLTRSMSGGYMGRHEMRVANLVQHMNIDFIV